MDELIPGLELLPAILTLSAVIGILISAARKIAEHKWPSLLQSALWRDLALPYAGVIVGLVYGYVVSDIQLSIIAGFISSHIYRTIKSKFTTKDDNGSTSQQ